MKMRIFTVALALISAVLAFAATPIYTPTLSLVEGMMNVDIDFNIAEFDLKSCESVVVTPYLENGDKKVTLESFGVYGRRSYIQYQRGNMQRGLDANPSKVFKTGKDAPVYNYRDQIEYDEWVDGATLGVDIEKYGCAGTSEGSYGSASNITLWKAPTLNMNNLANMLIYVQPPVDTVKTRELSGRANVDFQVNKTILLEDFRNNYAELSEIRASIDSVRNDKDVTVNTMSIKGFASPEGSYENNVRLAKGRTGAVVAYVERLYAFPKGFIKTSSDPEDWSGLRDWVVKSNIAHKEGILAIIDDTTLAPDPRDQKIKKMYPEEYAMLLNTVYPSLRHTDYLIEYTIRQYSDPKEILSVMKTRPGNLSPNEFFIAAQSLEKGSDEFNEVFEIAANVYPDNEVANLNAANAALTRRDLTSAAKYLAKAGNSKEADLARGMLAALQKDYAAADSLLREVDEAGVTQAGEFLQQLKSYRDFETARKKDKK